jgi:hypothetical protein
MTQLPVSQQKIETTPKGTNTYGDDIWACNSGQVPQMYRYLLEEFF